MSAALLKFNLFTGIYFAITAGYLSFYFQNVRTVRTTYLHNLV